MTNLDYRKMWNDFYKWASQMSKISVSYECAWAYGSCAKKMSEMHKERLITERLGK